MIRLVFTFLIAVVAVSQNLPAGVFDFVNIDFSGTITRADFATGAVIYETPGDDGLQGYGGLSETSDGRLIALRVARLGNPAAIMQIDPNTGLKTLLATSALGPTSSFATTMTQDGRLVNVATAGISSSFNIVDQNTLLSTPLNLTFSNSPFNVITNNLTTAPDGSLYTWINGNTLDPLGFHFFSSLYRIDLATNTATAISANAGQGAPQYLFNSMSFGPDGNLYGFTDINSNANEGVLLPNSAYFINTQTGEAKYVKSFNFFLGTGVEFVVSVPEPTSIGLLAATACIGFGYRRLRGRSTTGT